MNMIEREQILKKFRDLCIKKGHIEEGVINKIETETCNYLENNPDDLEIWYKIVLLEFHDFHDEYSAIKFLNIIWNRFKKIESLILIAFIQAEFLGGIDDGIYSSLDKYSSDNSDIMACIYFLKGMFDELGKPKLAIENYRKAISLKNNFVHAYFYLGHVLEREKDILNAKIEYEKAVSAVKQSLDNSYYDYYDIHNYFDEYIYGTNPSSVKFEILKDYSNKFN